MPPVEWFHPPALTEPTPLTVTPEGRVYGHAALWGSCHTGYPGRCVSPPQSRADYSLFHLGVVELDDGSFMPVGQLTLGTSHARLGLAGKPASEHYDHTGTAVADVRVGEDEHGIWFSGAIRPGLSADRRRELLGAKLSGDWRDGELIGLLCVNVPGFPVPRVAARVAASHSRPMALVAAGMLTEPRIAASARERMAEARHVSLLADVATRGADAILAELFARTRAA